MKQLSYVLILFFLIGCAGSQSKALEGMPPETPIQRVNLKGEDCIWNPDLIRVKHGNHVILDVESIDRDYNFRLKGYNLRFEIPKGKKVSTEFYASRAGTFEFGCYVEKGSHYLWGGMVGTLIVE